MPGAVTGYIIDLNYEICSLKPVFRIHYPKFF
jgi:hypothetical protein